MENPETTATVLPARMKALIERLVKNDTHLNMSEWLRAAAREKLQRDYPDEFDALIKEGEEE